MFFFLRALVALSLVLGLAAPGHAQDFYKGKTIHLVVPLAAGGSYDILARIVAQFMPTHIPGTPSMIIDNRPGGAYLIGARAVLSAPPDGLTLLHFPSTAIYSQLLGQGGGVDFSRFEFLGSAGGAYYVLLLRSAIKYGSFEELRGAREPLNIGILSPDSLVAATAKMFKDMAGVNIKLIAGYQGGSELELATQRGELDGYAAADVTFQSSPMLRDMLASGLVKPVAVLGGGAPNPDFASSFAALPKLRDYVKPGPELMAFDAFVGTLEITRPFATNPGVPRDRLLILRKAFLETLHDPQFLGAAAKAGFGVDPVEGEETGRLLTSILTMDENVRARIRQLLQ